MTKKQLIKNLKIVVDEHNKLQWSYLMDPEVLKTKAAWDKAVKLAKEKAKDELSLLSLQIKEIRESLDIIENSKTKDKESNIPQLAQDIISKIRSGCDWGPKGLVFKWASSSGRFIIITNPGHSCFAGRGEQKYGASIHYLLDTSVKCGDRGYELFRRLMVFEHEGRLTNEVLNRWKNFASDAENKTK